MNIEASLQKLNFQTEWQKLRVNILFTANWLNNEIKQFLAPFGITQKQYNILKILRSKHPETIAIQDLRMHMVDKMSDVSRIIDRLVKKKLIEKNPCIHDKRSNRVQITASGLELLLQIDKHACGLDEMMQGISLEKAEELNQLLNDIREQSCRKCDS